MVQRVCPISASEPRTMDLSTDEQYQPHLAPLAMVIRETIFDRLPNREEGDSSVEARAEGMVREVWGYVSGAE